MPRNIFDSKTVHNSVFCIFYCCLDLAYNLTLDADLQSSRVTSRGLFTLTNDRLLSGDVKVLKDPLCQDYQVHVQVCPSPVFLCDSK